MSFYIIDNKNIIIIQLEYFQIYSEKIFYRIEKFDLIKSNKKNKIFILIYDIDDFYTYLRVINNDFNNIKIITVNSYLHKLLIKTRNIDYESIQDFRKNIKNYIKQLEQ